MHWVNPFNVSKLDLASTAMSILQNAIESIQVGVEDFQSTDERRSASAIRNIAAGLLLLFKAKLCELSPPHDPELLIKKDLLPSLDLEGGLVFSAKGKKTVDVVQIKERLTALKVDADWKRLEEITSLRNDIEHYYVSRSPDAVREVVAKSFLLIRDFVVKELEQDPHAILGDGCWQVLLETSEVYSAEEKACQESVAKIDWKYSTIQSALGNLRCPECRSSLVEAPYEDDSYPAINLHCKSCSHDFSFSDVVEACVDELLSVDAHRNIKDGGESPYGTCPQCGKETFVHAEECCVACEGSLDYTNCSACDEPLSLDEQDLDGMCSYCKYKFDKLMRE
jgi:hypothetical protein